MVTENLATNSQLTNPNNSIEQHVLDTSAGKQLSKAAKDV